MPELFLIPVISTFEVHDAAIRNWLSRLDESALDSFHEYPFKLERFFPKNARRALKSADEVHTEIMHLLNIINPDAVFLDIPVDFIDLENKYNKRLISSLEFWSEYHQIAARGSEAIYYIYIKGIIDKEIRLIETVEHLPLSVVFYGLDIKSREELIPVYENILDKDGEFVLHSANAINELTQFREIPRHLWYSSMQARRMAISYEETEEFYNELLIRLNGLLKFKLRDFMVKSLRAKAIEFVSAFEKFLDYKTEEDEIKFTNMLEGLRVLDIQSYNPSVVVFCSPEQYSFLLNALRKEKRLHEGNIDISGLLHKMKPFTQKDRIMQNNYDIALNILGRKRTEKYKTPSAILTPVQEFPHSFFHGYHSNFPEHIHRDSSFKNI